MTAVKWSKYENTHTLGNDVRYIYKRNLQNTLSPPSDSQLARSFAFAVIFSRSHFFPHWKMMWAQSARTEMKQKHPKNRSK